MTITDKDGQQKNVGSAGVANTALGLGIGALGLELLRGGCGGNILGGLLGGGTCQTQGTMAPMAPVATMGTYPVATTVVPQDVYTAHDVENIKAIWQLRDYTDVQIGESARTEAERFYALDKQTDRNFFDIFADYSSKFATQQKQIDDIGCNIKVLDAVLPYIIKDATSGFVKGDVLVPASSIVYNTPTCGTTSTSACGNFYNPYSPVVTSNS